MSISSIKSLLLGLLLAIFPILPVFAQETTDTADAGANENQTLSGENVTSADSEPADIETREKTPADETTSQSSRIKADSPNHESQNDDPFELSPEELAEIEAALAADAAPEKNTSTPSEPATGFLAAVQSMNPDMALILDVALAYFSKDKNYQTGGHDPTTTGFNLQQLEMSFGASVDHFFRFDANLVFSLFGVELEEAYLTSLAIPGNVQIRAGQMLTRFGRLNNTHPHTWDFVDQPFVIGKFFGSEANRGLGLEISWLLPIPWYVEILGSATMANGSSTNRSYLGTDDREISGMGDFLYTAAIKQFFPITNNIGLNWGLSGQWGPNSTGPKNRTEIYGTDIFLKIKPNAIEFPQMFIAIQAEELVRIRQVPGSSLVDHGGYASLLWQINREWGVATRGEWGSGLNDDPLDPDWKEYRGRVALQGTYTGSHFSRIRAQLSVDIPRWENDPVIAAFIAVELVVGAHKAHQY